MPKIIPRNEAVRAWKGLHLFHAGWSNCSMRVRIVLEEKGLDWTSHHLDTRSGEHISPEYFGIHPKGLVPALVHDGDVWIESNDIIQYLDSLPPGPLLSPDDAAGIEALQHWIALASDIHVPGVKTFIYCAKRGRGKPPQGSSEYRQLQSDEELLRFHQRNASESGLSDGDRKQAESLLHEAFSELDTVLATNEWLAGGRFSLADISWVPLYYTLQRAGFSFGRHKNVMRWGGAIAARPSFTNAVVQWFDGPPTGDAQGASSPANSNRLIR